MRFCRRWLMLVAVFGVCIAQAQNEEAKIKKDKAIELMDNGQLDESIALLQEAKALDPQNYIYDYEIGLAQLRKEDYKASIKTYKAVVKYKGATDQCYQMLGNVLDISGQPAKAIKAYDDGLKLFPTSGRLFLEKGNVFWGQKKYSQALSLYEEGILFEPDYPSNYYRATLLYAGSTEKIWGILYGEIFRNLESNSPRSEEISNMLFDVYKSQIKFAGDSTSISFSKNHTINITTRDLKSVESIAKAFKMPYGITFEKSLLLAIANEKVIDIAALHRIRTRFINEIVRNEDSKKYPNILFDFHKRMIDAGHFEAYNYWLLEKGNETEFKTWKETHQEAWDAFMEWVNENGLDVNENNKFHSSQY
jgi:tetratricopeptide (TPR) repeat protein